VRYKVSINRDLEDVKATSANVRVESGGAVKVWGLGNY